MIHVFTLRKCSLVLKKEEEEGKGEGGGLQWGREARHEPIPEPGSRSCFRKVLRSQPARETHELPSASASLAAWRPTRGEGGRGAACGGAALAEPSSPVFGCLPEPPGRSSLPQQASTSCCCFCFSLKLPSKQLCWKIPSLPWMN